MIERAQCNNGRTSRSREVRTENPPFLCKFKAERRARRGGRGYLNRWFDTAAATGAGNRRAGEGGRRRGFSRGGRRGRRRRRRKSSGEAEEEDDGVWKPELETAEEEAPAPPSSVAGAETGAGAEAEASPSSFRRRGKRGRGDGRRRKARVAVFVPRPRAAGIFTFWPQIFGSYSELAPNFFQSFRCSPEASSTSGRKMAGVESSALRTVSRPILRFRGRCCKKMENQGGDRNKYQIQVGAKRNSPPDNASQSGVIILFTCFLGRSFVLLTY